MACQESRADCVVLLLQLRKKSSVHKFLSSSDQMRSIRAQASLNRLTLSIQTIHEKSCNASVRRQQSTAQLKSTQICARCAAPFQPCNLCLLSLARIPARCLTTDGGTAFFEGFVRGGQAIHRISQS